MVSTQRPHNGSNAAMPIATQRDVAAAAGVSVKTVSNVVNGFTYVAETTRIRVQQAIAELGYRPNVSAQSLRRGHSGLIALAIPSLRNPYFAELADLVVSAAEQQGKTVLVDCTHGKLAREQLVLEGFRHRVVDGLILCPHALAPADLRKRHDHTPLVMLGERIGRAADCVAIDSRAAADAATSHLIDIGRRRIGVIGFASEKRTSSVGQLRLDGYRQALQRAQVEPEPTMVELVPPELSGEDGQGAVQATRALFERHPDIDALFCFNDVIAIGAMHHLLASGVRVPEDVAVIGIDDIAASRLSWPGLSTIAPDKQRIADTAVTMLIERIEGRVSTAPPTPIGIELIVRDSTGSAG
jgi:DNA-binding LacI/PurR family transcriptional regulator